MKKRYSSKLNFSKEDFKASVNIGASGINMPYDKEGGYGFETKSFGSIFGSINSSKFYEGVNNQNIIPKEEDFIDVPFRLISSTIVGAGTWKATDFGKNESVLKGSMPLLEGKPLYKDHETDLDNWVGVVKAVKWTGSVTKKGVKIPSGIDGIVSIDAKTNPKVARGVLLGSIFSNSVTVDFDWEMSHDYSSEGEFNNAIGTLGGDGTTVRRVVTKINDYYESSLVWLGADPFAKAINEEGDLIHIDHSAVANYAKNKFGFKSSLSYGKEANENTDRYEKQKKFVIGFGIDENVVPLSRKEEIKKSDMNKLAATLIAVLGSSLNLTKNSTDKEALQALENFDVGSLKTEKDESDLAILVALKKQALENLGKEEVDFENFDKDYEFANKAELKKLRKSKKDFAKKLQDSEDEIESLESNISELEPMSKVGKKFSKQKKDEAIRLYKLTVGADKAEASVVSLFDKATTDEVEGLLKQYTKTATGKFTGKCKDCGSGEFTFQSTYVDKDGEDGEAIAGITTDDLRSEYDKPRMKIN